MTADSVTSNHGRRDDVIGDVTSRGHYVDEQVDSATAAADARHTGTHDDVMTVVAVCSLSNLLDTWCVELRHCLCLQTPACLAMCSERNVQQAAVRAINARRPRCTQCSAARPSATPNRQTYIQHI